jgi:threonine dehydrogenase-like Zn-dependent dehydrogenase
MRALVISGVGRYALLEHELPPAGPDDLLLAPVAVGLCATDPELLDGSMVYFRDGRGHLPLVPGHEWVARVVDPGEPGSGFGVGDLVVGECSIGCGSCAVCASGAYHQCPRRQETGVLNRDGALAQQLRFPARSAHAVPPGVTVEDAVFAEPTAVALRAVLRTGAQPRSRVLVVGGGTLGWLAAAIFLDLLEADVAALEPDAGRLERLAELGVRAAGAGELFEVVLEASGSPSGVTAALDRLGPGGRLVVIGLTGAELVAVDLDRVVVNDQVILGSLGSPDVWPQALELLGRGRVRPSVLVTHRYPLEAVGEALATMRDRAPGTGKVLVFPQEPGQDGQEHDATTRRSDA